MDSEGLRARAHKMSDDDRRSQFHLYALKGKPASACPFVLTVEDKAAYETLLQEYKAMPAETVGGTGWRAGDD